MAETPEWKKSKTPFTRVKKNPYGHDRHYYFQMFYLFVLYYIRDLTTTSNLAKVIQTLLKMEHHAQSVDDAFIGGLNYKLKAGASYVTNRRSVSCFAQGGN